MIGAAGIVLALAAVALLARLRSSPRGSMRTDPAHESPWQGTVTQASRPTAVEIAFSWDGEKGDNEDIYVKVIGTEVPLRLTTNPAARPAPSVVVGRALRLRFSAARPREADSSSFPPSAVPSGRIQSAVDFAG